MPHLVRPLIRLWPIAAIVLLLPCAAIAGGKATMATNTQTVQPGQGAARGAPSTTTIVWRDADTLRMDIGDQSGYLIMRDGKAYSVSQSNGKTQVMDLSAMSAMIQAMASKGGKNKNPFGSIDSVKATGDTDSVAGIEGRVYQIGWTDADGNHKSGDAVLTDDPLAVEMTRAYLHSIGAMVGADAVRSLKDSLPDDNPGLLRMGDEFRIVSINRADPPASTFKLPAKPVDFQSLMRGMSQNQ